VARGLQEPSFVRCENSHYSWNLKRTRGRPKKNWVEDIRKVMNERNLNEGQWKDRKQWSLGVGQRRTTFWNRHTYIHTYIQLEFNISERETKQQIFLPSLQKFCLLQIIFFLNLSTDHHTAGMNFKLSRTWIFLGIRYVMIGTKFQFFLLTRYCFNYLLTVSLRN